MTKLFSRFMALLFLAFGILAFTPATGCKTRLDPTGVYQGDVILFNADRTIVEAYEAFDRFTTWEQANRAALSALPQITQTADSIRDNARDWIRSAIALRLAYRTNPSAINRDALQSSLKILDQAIKEAIKYTPKTVK